MSGGTHLRLEERERLAALKGEGLSLRAMARQLGRAASTISRELRRNALPKRGYLPAHAEGCYLERRQRPAIVERDAKLGRFVRERLLEGWTPEQIAGWLKRGEGAPSTIGPRPSKSARTSGHWEGDLLICKRTRPVLVLQRAKDPAFILASQARRKDRRGDHARHDGGVPADPSRACASPSPSITTPPLPSTPCSPAPAQHDDLVLRRLCLLAERRRRKRQRPATARLPRRSALIRRPTRKSRTSS